MKKSAIRTGLAGLAAMLLAGSAFACFDNAYFPVVEGASWTYRDSSGFEFTQSITNVTADSFTIQVDMGADMGVVDMAYACEDGGVVSTSGLAGMAPAGFDMEVISAEGLTYPNDLSVGQTWSSELVTKANIEMEGVAATSTMTMQADYAVTAIEPVTVPAGTFDAMHITNDSTVTTVTAMMGMEIPFSVDTTGSTWLVDGVGMVLTESDGSRTELVEYHIP